MKYISIDTYLCMLSDGMNSSTGISARDSAPRLLTSSFERLYIELSAYEF